MTWKQAEDKTLQEIRSELCELCVKMIDILGKIKQNGDINQQEFAEYTRLKKKILCWWPIQFRWAYTHYSAFTRDFRL